MRLLRFTSQTVVLPPVAVRVSVFGRRHSTPAFRAASYQTLEASDLTRLPLPRLATDGALVAVWCTNSSAHHRTLRHTLLPAWGVRECAVWHWVKVGLAGAVDAGTLGWVGLRVIVGDD